MRGERAYLAVHPELASGLGHHPVLAEGTEVRHPPHDDVDDGGARRGRVTGFEESDGLGAEGDDAPLPVCGRSGHERDRWPVVRQEHRWCAVGRMHPPLEEVALADEFRDERGGRPTVDRLRGADLLDPADVHDHDAVGKAERLLLVVGDEDGGDVQRPLELPQLFPHRQAEPCVQVGERLVEQEDRGADDDRARHRYPLLLAARQLPGVAVPEAGEAHQVQRRSTRAPARGRHLAHPEPVCHVLGDGHVRERARSFGRRSRRRAGAGACPSPGVPG